MIRQTRFGEIEIIPGGDVDSKWEPIYKATEDKNGKVIDFAWFCPHCGREYKSRSSCVLHCAGKQGSYIATCPYLRIHQCNNLCRMAFHPDSKFAVFQ